MNRACAVGESAAPSGDANSFSGAAAHNLLNMITLIVPVALAARQWDSGVRPLPKSGLPLT